jgi:glycosyltransferase involved in cell wall biosynthesis
VEKPSTPDLVSIVVPLFNERESLDVLSSEIEATCESAGISWEVVFVDDGSDDGSASVLDDIVSRSAHRISVVHLRGNFGKSAALEKGFRVARGDVILTMDADLQDDPGEIPRFLDALANGFDVVSGFKKVRRDSRHKIFMSRVFNWMVRVTTGTPCRDVNCGFKAYRREVLDEISIYGELHRFIPVLASWRRFRVGEIVVNHRKRQFGRSKYKAGRYFRGLIDLSTVSFLTRFDTRPAHFFAAAGGLFLGVGLAICSYMSILWFAGSRPIGDRPLLLLGILLIVVGTQFIGMGLIAELVTRRHFLMARPEIYGRVVTSSAARALEDSKESLPREIDRG